MVELTVVAGLSLFQSGMFNKCLNCTGDREAINLDIIEEDLFEPANFDRLFVELVEINIRALERQHPVTVFECDLSPEALSEEPSDQTDFNEF